ncbi:MAG: 30S ribosomal protein S5 [Phycisphaerales bacterium]|nr:30S ribosomal protein S5 [Phycisphaerales bacterium]
MAKMMEEQGSQFETETLGIFRTASTVKGGRRFSFGALVVAGDRNGKVGFGHAKSKEVPTAIEKAEKAAKRAMVKIPRVGSTIPHQVEGRFGASKVRLIPASPGTGVVAGGTVRTVLEAAGVSDCLTKCYGSTNKMNMIRAVFDGLERLRTKEHVEGIRDQQLGTTEIESKIARGQRFMPKASSGEKMRGPVNTVGQEQRRGGRGGRGGPRGGGRGGYGGQAPQSEAPAAPDAPAPAPKG